MMIFKARQSAHKEYEKLLAEKDLTAGEVKRRIEKSRKLRKTTYYSPHKAAGTAANFLLEAA